MNFGIATNGHGRSEHRRRQCCSNHGAGDQIVCDEDFDGIMLPDLPLYPSLAIYFPLQ
jgi:hypothetical protein